MTIRIINADVDGREFLDGRVALLPGDCLDVMRKLPEASVDSIVTDPPYGLEFMGKGWDHGVPGVEFWVEALRVLKPGGHLAAFGGTRTYHRLAVAIEDAGFEIRDQLAWAYGSGFPKSLDVSKAIDKAAGVEREKIAVGAPVKRMIPGADQNGTGSWVKDNGRVYQPGIEIAATDEAKQWSGWGTALKPAWEPICLARKPLIGTVAANVLAHGTGGLNIDGCRVDGESTVRVNHGGGNPEQWRTGNGGDFVSGSLLGRFPANLIHDGSEEVESLFPEAGVFAPVTGTEPSIPAKGDVAYGFRQRIGHVHHGDSGSAARFFYTAKPDNGRDGEASADRRYTDNGSTNFAVLPGQRRDEVPTSRLFYTAKADADDRIASKHPTVKPVDLMQWLVRLVTPPKGTVLDPFAGTGTTGEAAWREGMNAVLIEREAEYQADIARRMDLADKPTKKASVVATAKKGEAPRGGLLDLMEAAAE